MANYDIRKYTQQCTMILYSRGTFGKQGKRGLAKAWNKCICELGPAKQKAQVPVETFCWPYTGQTLLQHSTISTMLHLALDSGQVLLYDNKLLNNITQGKYCTITWSHTFARFNFLNGTITWSHTSTFLTTLHRENTLHYYMF